jgi:hypothetical protein
LAGREYLTPFLFDPFEGLLYFVPFILMLRQNSVFYRKLFDFIIIFGICYVIFDVIFIKNILISDVENKQSQGIVEYFSNLSFCCGFILLTFIYHKKKRVLFALFVTVLALLIAIFRARRGLTFMYSIMLFFSFIFYFFHTRAKVLITLSGICFVLILALYFMGTKLSDTPLLRNFFIRVNEDTRSYVEDRFHADMKTKDWIYGKGLNGRYFCPGVEENEVYRGLIETGYETTILKGGLISIGLFLLITVPAIINGLFFSKNLLSKAAAIWILMSLINSYPGTTQAFILSYFVVWVSVGICYSKEIRNMSDDTITTLLYPENYTISEPL